MLGEKTQDIVLLKKTLLQTFCLSSPFQFCEPPPGEKFLEHSLLPNIFYGYIFIMKSTKEKF